MRTSIFPLLFFCASAYACTAFQLKSQDGAAVYFRSMEFAFHFDSDLLIVPRGSAYAGTGPGGQAGMKWAAKYGFAGMNQKIAPTFVSDGLNEKGLSVGCLYLPGFAKYEDPDPKRSTQTIGPWELPTLLLGTCATLDDVKQMLQKIVVADIGAPMMNNFIPPLHFYVSDQKGSVLIVEYVGGKKMVYDNPLGALTNSPPFAWHQVNLSNFINLTPVNVSQMQLPNFHIKNLSQGSGLLGIPGDYTSPSRFVRSALYSQWALVQKTAAEAVQLGFHILNTFDIFEGIVRNPQKDPSDNAPEYETTQWVIAHDKSNLQVYFRDYGSLQIQMVDLKKIDLSKGGFRIVPMRKTFEAIDDTSQIQPLKIQ